MNENRKSLVLIIAIIIVIGGSLIISLTGGKRSEEVYKQFSAAFTLEKPTLIYIGRPTCKYCSLLNPSLEEMKERYNFDYIYVNTDDINSEYMNKIMAYLKIKSIGTPYLAVVNSSGIVDTQNGYVDYDALFAFLQTNGIIAADATLPIKYIGLSEYKNLLANVEPSIVVVGQSTCSYCIKTKLVLNQIADENEIIINYLNISNLTEEEGKELEASVTYFSENEGWGTPVTFIIENGKVIATLEGYNEKGKFISFFKEQGVLK